MKKFKKLTALLLAFLMMAVYVPVMAENVTAEIIGDSVLFAPPTDVLSKVEYEVKLTPNTEKVAEIEWSLSKPVAGVSLNTDTGALVLNGASIAVDSFTLTAAGTTSEGAAFSASLDITIPDVRFDYNFNDLTEDATAYTYAYKLSDGSKLGTALNPNNNATVKKETDGNQYAYATSYTCYLQYTPTKLSSQASNVKAAKRVTLSAKVRDLGGDRQIKENATSTNGSITSWIFKVDSGVLKEKYGIYNEDGTYVGSSDYLSTGGKISTTGWTDFDLVFDYDKRIYTLYLDGELVSGPKRLRESECDYLDNAYFAMGLDDIAFYSGEPFVPEVPYTIEGTDSIYLPGDNDAASIQYVLKNKDDDSVVSDAVYSVSGTGVEMLSDGRLLVNKNTTPGKITISAYSPTETYQTVVTKEVTVQSEKWFYDFESYTVGGTPSLTSSANDTPNPGQINRGSASVTHKIIGETNSDGIVSNKYYGFDGADYTNAEANMHYLYSLNSYFNSTAIVEFDFLINTTNWLPLLKIANGTGRITYLTYNMNGITCAYNQSGASGTKSIMALPGWHHMRLELNNSTYSIWVDGKLWIDNYKNYNGNLGYLNSVHFGSPIDNLSIYTGSNYSLVPTGSADELTVPGVGSSQYTLSSLYSDGTEVTKELTYRLEDSYTGVSISGNTLTVDSTAEMVPVTVNVTDGFVYGSVTLHTNKDYILVNGEVYEDGTDVINAAGTYIVKAAYGSSSDKANYTMYLAQYEGSKLVKVIPASVSNEETLDLNAELSGSFSATDNVKVFLWDNNLVPVRTESVIQ